MHPSLSRLRYKIRDAVIPRPAYIPYARWRFGVDTEPGPKAVGPDTDVVIEGFPRSANSFATEAFRLAQPRPPRIANHLHAPSQLIVAARLGVPVIALIREPHAAARSFNTMQRYLEAQDILESYLRFYRTTLPYREHFVVARFEEVTGDFGEVIQRVNRKYGTEFTPFDHTEANVERCFEVLDERVRARNKGKLRERSLTRPSEDKKAAQQRFEKRLEDPHLADLMQQAEEIYRAYTS